MKTTITIIILSLSLTLFAAEFGTYSASGSLKVSIRIPQKNIAPDSATYCEQQLPAAKNTLVDSEYVNITDCFLSDGFMNIRVSNIDSIPHVFDFDYGVFAKVNGSLLSSGFKEAIKILPGCTLCLRYSVRSIAPGALIISSVNCDNSLKKAAYSI